MLRLSFVFVLLVLLVGDIQAAPRPRTRMVMKIRPMGRALDIPVAGPLHYDHVSVEDPEVKTMAAFAGTALSFANIKSAEPLDLVRISSASKRADSTISSDYKLTLVLSGQGQFYYCNAGVSERVTNVTNESSHREVHLTQPSSCIQGPQELIMTGEEGSLSAALFAASELSKTVLVLHTAPTLRNVSQWEPVEKAFGNEYKLGLTFANNENGQLHCLAEVIDRTSHNDRQIVRVDCSPAAAADAAASMEEELEKPADVNAMAEFVTTFLKESRNLDLSLLKVTAAQKTPYDGFKIRPAITLSTRVENEDVFYYCNAAVFQDLKTHDYELIRSLTTCSNTPPQPKTMVEALSIEVMESKPVGAYDDVPTNDEDVKQMASFATFALTSSMNAGARGSLNLLKIVSAQRQVVAGTNHKLLLDLSSTDGQLLHCMVVVFDQPWTNTRELSEAMCRPGQESSENDDD